MSMPVDPRPRNGFGIAAFVLGLLALLLSWTIIGGIILGILATIFGVLGWGRVRRGESTVGGLSIAGLVLGVLGLLITIALFAFGVSLFNSPAGQNYKQCIEESGSDRAKIDQCTEDFSREIQSPR